MRMESQSLGATKETDMTDTEAIRFITSHLIDINTAKPSTAMVYYIFSDELNGKVSLKLGDLINMDAFDSEEAATEWLKLAKTAYGETLKTLGHLRVKAMTQRKFISDYREEEER